MADASTVSVLIQARDNASQALKNVEGNMKSLGASFERHRRGIGMAATAIGAAVTGVAVLSIKSSLDQQIGIDQLDAALKNVNTSYAAQEATIEKVIAAQQNKTNFGDEEQRKALRELILVSGSYDDAMAALIPTIELAAGKNMDLSAAATLVARAISGEETALGRYGIQVEKGAGATAVLSAIMESFGGQAEAAANPVTQLKNRLGDLMQVLGDALLPVIEKLVPMIEGLVRKIIDWAEAHPTLAKVLGIVVAALGALLLVIGPLLLLLPTIVAAVGLLSVAFGTLSVAMGPITLAIIAIAALVTGAIIVWKKWDDMSTKVKIAVVALGIALGPITAAIVLGIAAWKNWDKIVEIVRRTIGTFTKEVIGFIIKLGEGFLAITKWIPGMGDTRRAIEGTMDSLRDSQDAVEDWGNNTQGKLREQSEAWGAMEDAHFSNTENMKENVEKVARATEDSTAQIVRSNADVEVSMEEVARAAELGWGHVEDQVMHASGVVVQSVDEMIATQERWEASQDASLSRLRDNLDTTLIKWKSTGLGMEDIVQGWADQTGQSVEQVLDHWDDIDLDLDDLKGVFKAFTNATGADIFNWANSVNADSRSVKETFGSTSDSINADSRSIKETFASTSAAISGIALGIHDTIAGIHRDASRPVPAPRIGGFGGGRSGIHVTAPGFDAATVAAGEALAPLRGTGGSLAGYAPGTTFAQIEAALGLANGGIVRQPTLAMIGERGPEAVVPLGRGGGMGTTNQFHFHGAVYGVEDLKEAVVEAVRDHAISGGFSGVFAEA